MLEKDIERKVCERARDSGWLVYKFTSPARRSVPDRMFIKNGRVVFIELKRPGERLTSGQAREIERLRAAGAEVHVAYSVEEAKEILEGPLVLIQDNRPAHPHPSGWPWAHGLTEDGRVCWR